jgi:hypothetical protein
LRTVPPSSVCRGWAAPAAAQYLETGRAPSLHATKKQQQQQQQQQQQVRRSQARWICHSSRFSSVLRITCAAVIRRSLVCDPARCCCCHCCCCCLDAAYATHISCQQTWPTAVSAAPLPKSGECRSAVKAHTCGEYHSAVEVPTCTPPPNGHSNYMMRVGLHGSYGCCYWCCCPLAAPAEQMLPTAASSRPTMTPLQWLLLLLASHPLLKNPTPMYTHLLSRCFPVPPVPVPQ